MLEIKVPNDFILFYQPSPRADETAKCDELNNIGTGKRSKVRSLIQLVVPNTKI
jgi:hypothetical protein